MKNKKLCGIPVSPGVAVGTAKILENEDYAVSEKTLGRDEVEWEVSRFLSALRASQNELLALRRSLSRKLGKQSRLLDAQLLVFQDEVAVDETIQRIRGERKNAAYVFQQVLEKTQSALEASRNGYLKERSADIRDVGRRIMGHLLLRSHSRIEKFPERCILVAHNLFPSDLFPLSKRQIQGFATEMGGRASHIAIMAHSMGIPAVVGLKGLLGAIKEGDCLILDGNRGQLWIRPERTVARKYRAAVQVQSKQAAYLKSLKNLPAETRDGCRITLEANIEWPKEAEAARSSGATGIGLFRTEFLWIQSHGAPEEEEQFRAYRTAAKIMAPGRVVIRSFDLGGDKLIEGGEPEPNPFLGFRAIRYFLKERKKFESQVRAVLRASVFGNVALMLPMVTSLEELREAAEVVEETKRKLSRKGVAFDPDCPVGIMIETPSAALLAERLARETAFFSLGTNDLTQYTLAVDRGNKNVAPLFDQFHPAVLDLIGRVAQAGITAGIPVSLCGEMASDSLAIPILLGLGLRELSMVPASIPMAKAVIRSLKLTDIEGMMREAAECETGKEIRNCLIKYCKRWLGKTPIYNGLSVNQQ